MRIVGLSKKGARQLPLIISWAVFIILSLSYLVVANAGTVLISNTDNTLFLFEDKVEEGDAKQLTVIPNNSTLYLNSPGGDFLEGLAMGYIIKSKNFKVRVYPEGSCYSSCAFAAMLANDVQGTFHFHAPYDAETGKSDPHALEVMRAYLEETGRFTDQEIDQISKTSKDQYLTLTF